MVHVNVVREGDVEHPVPPPTADEWLEAFGMDTDDNEDTDLDDEEEDDNPISIYRQHMLLEEERKLKEHEKSSLQTQIESQKAEDHAVQKTLDISISTTTTATNKPGAVPVQSQSDYASFSKNHEQLKRLSPLPSASDDDDDDEHDEEEAMDIVAEPTRFGSQQSSGQYSTHSLGQHSTHSLGQHSMHSLGTNPLDTWQIVESEALEEIEPLPQPSLRRTSGGQRRESQVGAFDETESGNITMRRKVSFSLFGSTSNHGATDNDDPNDSKALQKSQEFDDNGLIAEVRRSDTSTDYQPNKDISKRSMILYAIVTTVVVVIVIIVVVIIVVATQSGSDDDPDGVSGGGYVSRAQGEALLLGSMDYPTHALIKKDPASAQARAFEWVIQDPEFELKLPWRHRQRFALATLYFSTQGPQWNLPHDWLSYNISECQWKPPLPGAANASANSSSAPSIGSSQQQDEEEEENHCNPDGEFVNLQLDAVQQFSGTVPYQIEFLTQLKEIHITNMESQLSLPRLLPEQLSKLTQLESLDFSGSNLENSYIPTLIGTLTSLKDIHLANAGLAGTLPTEIGGLSDLVTLDVSENQLGWALPPEYSKLSNLLFLYLQNNKLIGALPIEWEELNYIQELDLSNNEFTGSIPLEWGEGMLRLNSLRAHHNEGLVGTLPPRFCNLMYAFLDCERIPCCGGISCECS